RYKGSVHTVRPPPVRWSVETVSSASLLRTGRIKFHWHGVLRVNGNVAGQLHGNLPLAIFRGLKRESAGGKSIFQAHSDHASVRTVTNPPNVLEIGLQQIPAGSNFGGIGRTDVRRTKRQLNSGRGGPKGCERH